MQDADAQDLVQAVLMRVAGAIQRWEKSGPENKFATESMREKYLHAALVVKSNFDAETWIRLAVL